MMVGAIDTTLQHEAHRFFNGGIVVPTCKRRIDKVLYDDVSATEDTTSASL